MAWVNDSMIERAGRFLWTSGRVLEQRRFAFHFADAAGGYGDAADGTAPTAGTNGTDGPAPTNGPAATDRTADRTADRTERAHGVLAALDAYGTAGGGYAFGLEPDVRGPVPQPVSVPAALAVLAEVGALHGTRVRRLCDWLGRVTAADGGVPAVLPSLRRYPRPPWLPIADAPAGDLLATGQIVGPLLRAEIDHPWLGTAVDFCRRAVEGIQETHPYDVVAAVAFLDHAPDRPWARRQAERLGDLVREQRLVLLDPDRPEEAHLAPGYAPGEYHLPHDYAPTPASRARAWFTDAELHRGLSYLAGQQQEDGGWPVRWAKWSPTTEMEARPGVTLAALLTLRAHDRP